MKKLTVDPRFPYVYETHLHTSEGSKCGQVSAEVMAQTYKQAGYTGIFVTDHFYGGNTAIDRSLPWSEWVDAYAKGYENAKRAGEKIGLQVFFGWEQTNRGTDFLVYGLDKEWLKMHPEMKDAEPDEQYRIVRAAGGMVVHAHPFREAAYIPEIRLFPNAADAVEIINTSHKNPEYNRKARVYADEHGFPYTSGSDIHDTNLLFGGMAFSRKIESARDYARAVLNREGVLLTGREWTEEP